MLAPRYIRHDNNVTDLSNEFGQLLTLPFPSINAAKRYLCALKPRPGEAQAMTFQNEDDAKRILAKMHFQYNNR